MATIRRLRFDPRSGPLVAALGSIAAGTLVAAISLGQSIGPLPIDNPAIAIMPGSNGAPVILNVAPVEPEADVAAALTVTSTTDLGLADATFPPRELTSTPVVSSSEEEERTEPADPQNDTVRRVQRVVGNVMATLTGPLSEGRSGDKAGTKERERSKRSADTAARRVLPIVKIDTGAGVIDVAQAPEKVAAPVAQAPIPQPAETTTTLTESLPPVTEQKPSGA